MHRSLLTTVALAHLMLVMCGAFRWTPYPEGVLLRSTLRFYMAMSGADGYYGFFAPVVDPEVRIRFRLVDRDGREEFVTLRDGATAEANLRLGAVGRLLPSSTPETREKLIRSLAAATLDKHPQAEEITVLVETFGVLRADGTFDIPSMSEYRRGARSEWLPVQVVTLARPGQAWQINQPELTAGSTPAALKQPGCFSCRLARVIGSSTEREDNKPAIPL